MATGAAIAAAAIAGLSAVDQNQTMRRQDRETAAGIRQNMALQEQANQKVARTIQQQAQSNATKARVSQNDKYLQQLQQQQQLAQQRLARTGFGDAYDQLARRAAANEDSYATRLAGLMSAVDAPSLQRQQESYNFGDLGTELGMIGRDASGNQYVTQQKVNSVRPNPWLQAAGQAAQAYAAGAGG